MMRFTSMLLAILGGLLGMVMSFVHMGISDDQGAGLLALLLSVAGIVGGGLVRQYPRRGMYLEIAGAVGGLLILSALGWLVFLLFAVAVFLAYRGQTESAGGGETGPR